MKSRQFLHYITADHYKHSFNLGIVSRHKHENVICNLLFNSIAAFATLLETTTLPMQQHILQIKDGELGALCQTVTETATLGEKDK